MLSSHEWRLYFENNSQALLQIPWEAGPELTEIESAAIATSLAEFQRGENSEGSHLLQYAREYADRAGDQDYVQAVRLFIAEEQRHARDLGRFLTLNGIPLVTTTFTDRVFRRLRHLFGGLEISIGVLITAEIIAKVYYAALKDATESRILKRLCEQILRDEIKHVEFQAEQLALLRKDRRPSLMSCTAGLQRFLFWGTCFVVWVFHRKALKRGGLSFKGFWRWCWTEFNQALEIMAPDARTRIVREPTHARHRQRSLESASR